MRVRDCLLPQWFPRRDGVGPDDRHGQHHLRYVLSAITHAALVYRNDGATWLILAWLTSRMNMLCSELGKDVRYWSLIFEQWRLRRRFRLQRLHWYPEHLSYCRHCIRSFGLLVYRVLHFCLQRHVYRQRHIYRVPVSSSFAAAAACVVLDTNESGLP